MGNPRCKWVRDRLPLMAGDELQGPDRRRVERHLIGCPDCRAQQVGVGQALEVLRTVAATPPAAPDAPSLWPALARQIRESRRPVATPTFAFALARFRSHFIPGPALGLGLGLLATIGVSLAVRHQLADARAHIAANTRPIAVAADLRARMARPQAPEPRYEPPQPVEVPVVEAPQPPRFDFDLEHGRPMSPDLRDSRDTKATY